MTSKVYVITGARGVGKSTAIAYFPRPSEISKMVICDTENSMSGIIEDLDKLGLKFGAYLNMHDRIKDKDLLKSISLAASGNGNLPWVSNKQKGALIDFYEYFLEQMDKVLVQGQYKFLGIDTIDGLEAGLSAWAEVNRAKSGWSGARDHGKLEYESIRPLYTALLESIHRRGVEHILLSSHLSGVWHDGKPVPGKTKPGGRLALLSRLSTLMLWLVQDNRNADGAPAALVLKGRHSLTSVDKEGDEWNIMRPLPPRIPAFNWKNFRHYANNGYNRENPLPGETISDSEFQMMDEFLSSEQMRLMIVQTELEMQENRMAYTAPIAIAAKPDISEETVDNIKAALSEGMTPSAIATGTGIPLPIVLRVKKGDV